MNLDQKTRTITKRHPVSLEHRLDQSAEALMARYEFSRGHARQVGFLAVRLAEQLSRELILGAESIRLVRYAALLHDIGWHYGQTRHHRRSYKIIKTNGLKGLSPEQIELIALIARYHRKASPKISHKPFARQDPIGRQTVLRLAGILRVADALDRSHRSAVQDVIVHRSRKGVCLEILPRIEDTRAEVSAAQRKKKLLEIALSQPVSLIVARSHATTGTRS